MEQTCTHLADGGVVLSRGSLPRLRVRGPDARAFLHRLSTQHVKDLPPGAGRLNVFPNDKGRIVEIVHHLDEGEEGVLLVGSEGRADELLAWLDRYHFAERLEVSAEPGDAVEISGARAAELLEAVGLPGGHLAPWGFSTSGLRRIVRTFDRVTLEGNQVPSLLVLVPEGDPIRTELIGAGAVPWSAEEAEAARIAAGAPRAGHEIDARFNPLDLGLHDAIHWAKGCYIGQEVIARLDTYGKQNKRLVGLRIAADQLARLQRGDPVFVRGAAAGEVTSIAPGWVNDRWPSALAVLRGAADGEQVELGAEPRGAAEVVALATAQVPHD